MTDKNLTSSQEKTRTALINAGLALILTQGYENITVTDITNYADYGRSTFYVYFKDKEDMAWQLLKYQADQLNAYIMNEVADLPSPKREWQAWYIMISQIDRQKEFFIKLDGELSYKLRQLQRQYLVENFEAHYRSGFYRIGMDLPPDVSARIIVGALLELLDYWLQKPDIGTPQDITNMLYRMVFHELSTPMVHAKTPPD